MNGSNYLGYIGLNSNGEGHSKDGSRATLRFLPPGTYYVKEGYIPSGCSYERNDTVYTVNVTKNHTTTAPLVLRVSDKPVAAPLSVLLQKRNATSGADAQADMSGAEYTVSFYTDFLDEETIENAAPARTWVFSVDKSGLCRYDSEHLVSGDALYTDSSGNNVLPLERMTVNHDVTGSSPVGGATKAHCF